MSDDEPRTSRLTALIVAGIAAVPPTLTGIAALVVSLRTSDKVVEVAGQVKDVQRKTDGLTEKLVESTRSDATQKGRAQGVAAQKKVAKDEKTVKDAQPWWKK